MFEREVKFIYDFNSNKVKKLGPSATFAELLPLGIHPAILQYIGAEIEFRVFEDRQTLLKHSMFDYSGTKISKHFQKIADEIKKEKRFSTDFFSKVILHATSFNVNYLIRPNWSLRKLIFDSSDSNNVAEILQILNYAYFYKHITKVIRNYLEKKKIITLDKEEFADLLTKFDNVSIDTYGKDVLESAIKAMSSFFNIGSMKQNTVPLQGMTVFLQEKKLSDHIESIQKNIDGDIKGKIQVSDLRSILLNVPLQRTEVLDVPKESEEEKMTFETEKLEPELEEEKIEEIETSINGEKELEEVQKETEQVETEDEEETIKEEEVEIKLRENKEKEVAEVEEEAEPVEEIADEEPEEVLKDENDEEEITEEKHDEFPPGKEDIDDALEYFIDEVDKKTDEVILTAEDDEVHASKDSEEILIEEDDKSELEDEEEIELVEQEEPEDETELISDEMAEFEDEKEVNLVDEIYPSTEDDYSYPVSNEEKTDEPNEDDFEKVDELEIDGEDEILEVDKEPNEIIEDEIETVDEMIDSGEQIEEATKEENEPENEIEEETPQATLFGDIPEEELIDKSEPEDDFIEKFGTQNHQKRIDIADLLENKNMTKIIAVVFDYDMEEFANAVEKICESENSQDAFGTLNEIFEMNQVNPSSKEAQAFKEIISEYFEQE